MLKKMKSTWHHLQEKPIVATEILAAVLAEALMPDQYVHISQAVTVNFGKDA